MNSMAWLCLLGLVKESSQSDPLCPPGCQKVDTYSPCGLRHLSTTLGNRSVARWALKADTNSTREPHTLMRAVCEPCSLPGWVVRAVQIEMSVYYRMDTHRDHHHWCQCPYKIPVACTCVQLVKHKLRARHGTKERLGAGTSYRPGAWT